MATDLGSGYAPTWNLPLNALDDDNDDDDDDDKVKSPTEIQEDRCNRQRSVAGNS